MRLIKPWLLFDRPGTTAQGQRRLMLVSYHFPPDYTIGSRRWAKIASFAADRGWGLDVITKSDDAHGPARAQLEELPPGTRVWGVPTPRMAVNRIEQIAHFIYRAAGFGHSAVAASDSEVTAGGSPLSIAIDEVRLGLPRTWRELLRAYFAWCQLRRARLWAHDAGTLARALHVPGVHIAVASSGPPHLTHEAARIAAATAGLPFVMDMRDPWTLVQQLPESIASPLWIATARREEARLVRAASLVVANTPLARDALIRRYPDAEDRIITVMNGSDDERIPPSRHGDRFLIVYAGTVYQDSDPRSLLDASARVIRALELPPERFGLEIVLADDGMSARRVRAMARELGIARHVRVQFRLSRKEALDIMSRGAMLTLFARAYLSAVPAKTFECVRFAAWVLAVAPPGSATAELLRQTGADILDGRDIEALAGVIRARYLEFRAGVRPRPVVADDRFSRATQAKILLDAIERLPDGAGAVRQPSLREAPLDGTRSATT